jgi:hypothetical protein
MKITDVAIRKGVRPPPIADPSNSYTFGFAGLI